MKKNYLFPEAELIVLLSNDVITDSAEDEYIEEDQDKDDVVKDDFAPRYN